jgi:predicted unusual protein kinase regulating ubiquinone biosynthesis (AarF/ABC1/UbiB family)
VIYFTRYLLLVQLELFNKYGFVHNDIHLGNILIKKEKSTINFNYKDNNIKLDTDIKLYLTDFEYSLILFYSINPKIKQFLKDINNRNYDYTLEKNIYNTFYCCLELLEDEKMKTKLHHLLARGKIDDYSIEKYHDKTKRSLDEYSSGRRPENNFITITNIHANEIISALFKLLFQQSFL